MSSWRWCVQHRILRSGSTSGTLQDKWPPLSFRIACSFFPCPRSSSVYRFALPRHVPQNIICTSVTRALYCPPSQGWQITESHFCLPLFFFFRLKKQQHLQINQTLIGLRVVSFWSVCAMTPTCSTTRHSKAATNHGLFSQTKLLGARVLSGRAADAWVTC